MQWNRSVRRVWAPIPREAADALVEVLTEAGWGAAAWEDADKGGLTAIEIYLDATADPAAAAKALQACSEPFGLRLEIQSAVLPAQDWAESWKRFFHVTRVSPRLVICPVWEPYGAQPGECVIAMDPGLSFGTGNHATTQACLQFLDQAAAEDAARDVLDAGCGSGILAIAALKLGFQSARGFDNDPEAVAAAAAMATRNSVDAVFEPGDVATWSTQADVVVANILAPVLIQHAARLAACVRPGCKGALLFSGVLAVQYPRVVAAFAAQGFTERAVSQRGEWRSAWLVRGE